MNMPEESTELKGTHCPRLFAWDGLAAADFCQDKKSFKTLTPRRTYSLT